ncbi:ALK tyrosine kinase receptor-like isoform X1 [Montipora capricornis]|uniref:ALK tyrosine kinase receptor-like isoform X1 n=1 Tax=Montipora capricornis TaxID=246305 RepID=UPI0035F193E7
MVDSLRNYPCSVILFHLCLITCNIVCTRISFPGSILTRENYRLKGHTFKSFVTRSQILCTQGCLSNASCYSTNFKDELPHSHQNGLCELNSEATVDFKILENDLHYEHGFIYTRYPRDTTEDCRWSGCQNNGSCVQQEKTYACICEIPWTGSFCETKITLYNFTTLGAKGRLGPESNVNYSGTGLEQVKVNKGVQEWQVPVTARFNVEACGASGGDGIYQKGARGGRGAKVRGILRLEKGDKLRIVVGQRGLTESNQKHGSGGGGTFVFRPTNRTGLILAAGGGGGGSQVDGLPGNDQPNGSGNAAGSNGNGGIVCLNVNALDARTNSGSGAGFNQSGGCHSLGNCSYKDCEKGGRSLDGYFQGGKNCDCDGGFGGGGACGNSPGGGGGYSGGGVASNREAGGGGSYIPSHNNEWNATKGGCDEGDGYVSFVIVD